MSIPGSSLPPLPPRPDAIQPRMTPQGATTASPAKDVVLRVLLTVIAAGVALAVVEFTIGVAVDDRAEAGKAIADWYRTAYGGAVLAAVGACLLGYLAYAGGSSARAAIDASLGAAMGIATAIVAPFITDPIVEGQTAEWIRMIPSAVLGGLFGTLLGFAKKDLRQALVSGIAGLLAGACARGVVLLLDVSAERFPSWMVSYLAIAVLVATFIATAQAIARVAWMTVVDGPLTGKQFIVSNSTTTIGRNYQCDLVFAKDPMIADQHLRIDRDKNGNYVLYVAPGASAAVNGQLAGSAALRHGDMVSIGSTALRFELRNAG